MGSIGLQEDIPSWDSDFRMLIIHWQKVVVPLGLSSIKN